MRREENNLVSVWLSLFALAAIGASTQTSAPIDVDALPVITELPDPFLKESGERIHSRLEWKAQRKMLLDKVLRYEYGALPPVPRNVVGKEVSSRPVEGGQDQSAPFRQTSAAAARRRPGRR